MERKLLIVDDEEKVLRALLRQLSFEGYDVITAPSGEEGLKLLKKEEIPVIISDHKMPHMTGAEFLKEVREQYPNSIRMILSGYADFEAVSDAINEGGIYKFLVKPWDDKTLISHIDKAFEFYQKKKQEVQAGQAVAEAIEAVITIGKGYNIESVNPACCQMLGYYGEELVGKPLSFIYAEEKGAQQWQEIEQTLKEKRHWQGNMYLYRSNKEPFLVFLSVAATFNQTQTLQSCTCSFIDINDGKQKEEELRYLYQHDALTGLINRDVFVANLSQQMLTAEEKGYEILVVLLNLERFRQINGALGHYYGDLALKGVADKLKQWSIQGETIARLEGDNFALTLPYEVGTFNFLEYLSGLERHFTESLQLDKHELHLTVNAGVSRYPMDGSSAEELMKHANIALTYVKEKSLGKYQCYRTSMQDNTKHKLILENDIRKAIKANEFLLHYQPKLSLNNNRIEGVEALVRWNHPEFGLVPPCDFLPLCEETGLIVEIERKTLHQACELQQRFIHDIKRPIQVSLNLSAQEFSNPELLSLFHDVIRQYDIPTEQIEIEVTESLLLEDMYVCEKTLKGLHELGIKLALDDFGTGYSSLSYLTHLPFDTVKIDQSFTKQMLVNDKTCKVLYAILNLCKSLSLQTVVEGVEDQEQLALLKTQACDYVQGYLIAKPLSKEKLIDFFNKHPNSTTMQGIGKLL